MSVLSLWLVRVGQYCQFNGTRYKRLSYLIFIDNNSVLHTIYSLVAQGLTSLLQSIQIVEDMSSPLVYRALLSQSGTDAPVATVLENTLGGVPVWSRSSAGVYRITLSGAFPTGKVGHNCDCDIWNSNATFLMCGRVSDDAFNVESRLSNGTNDDLGGGESYFEILVYP